jgi:hypothetical protein
MPDEKDSSLDPDEVREEIHSAVERIREQLPDLIESEPGPDLLKEPTPPRP